MKRRFSGSVTFFQGMAMGAADVVPGVSGGTVAYILGIYERLINALGGFKGPAIKSLLTGHWRRFWQLMDGTFLLLLFSGIVTSIATLARLISWILEFHPQLLWAYFFGLIVASCFYIGRQFDIRHPLNITAFMIAALLAFALTTQAPVKLNPSYPVVFLSGCIAICAMVLPGISGSFILVLLGMYQPIINAVKAFEASVLACFIAGCITGLLSFTHLLAWLLRSFHALTLAALTGFMVGSLNKVWPWKAQVMTADGYIEQTVSPLQYQQLVDQDPQIAMVLMVATLGLMTVYLLNRAGNGNN